MTGFQAVGRLGVDRQEAWTLGEAPIGIVWIVVPLPGEFQVRGGRSEEGRGRCVEIVDEIGRNER